MMCNCCDMIECESRSNLCKYCSIQLSEYKKKEREKEYKGTGKNQFK